MKSRRDVRRENERERERQRSRDGVRTMLEIKRMRENKRSCIQTTAFYN